MAAPRIHQEENELMIPEARAVLPAAAASDDERSVAADSWSVKSDYGSSALDDEQRQADADVAAAFPATASDYSSDKDGSDANDVEPSILGFQSYWDSSYAEDLANFQLHGQPGEVWFGEEVMDTVASWTKNLCMKTETNNVSEELSSWSVLDLGTGNGLLLHALAKQGFSDLTGTDYSEGAIELAKKLATRDSFTNINFLVDDVLETKLDRRFTLVMDKGTLDAIRLHPEGPVKRMMYWESVANLVAPGGMLVITSCNSTKEELIQEVENFNQKQLSNKYPNEDMVNEIDKQEKGAFKYLDHVRTYPTFKFGGVEGSRVCTVAFNRP